METICPAVMADGRDVRAGRGNQGKHWRNHDS